VDQENNQLAKAGKKRLRDIAADNDPMEMGRGRKAVIYPEMCSFIETNLLTDARICECGGRT
jgi:hypothetical protein